MASSTSILITSEQHEACVAAIREGFSKTLGVRMPLTASQWADEHFYLSPESSGTEGRWETLPYQVGILDVMGADEPRIVDVRKSARVGYSKMLDILVGYFLEHKRRNTALYQPTDEAAKKFCKSEIDPMIRDVPVLSGLAGGSENKKRDDTLAMKRLGKKVLYILGAKSGSKFRQITADSVFYDELDAYDPEIGDEGDPIKLGDRCITNSSFPKSIRGSTPTTKHGSLIYKESGNAKHLFRYFVECPECKHAQPLVWEQFKWDEVGDNEDRANTARYICAECHVPWHYGELWGLLESGHWETLETDEDGERVPGYRILTGDGEPILQDGDGVTVEWPRHVAFHIWAAYSPFMSWSELVLEWLEAQGDVLKLKTFTNHRFGEVWEDEGETVDENDIYNARENYSCPDSVLAVLAAIDVQDNRVEVGVGGFGYGEDAYHMDHRIIYGDTSKIFDESTNELASVWRELNDYLSTTKFSRDDGVLMAIDAVGIDTGYQAETVYRYINRCTHGRIYALKGIGGEGKAVVSAPTRQRTVDDVPIDLFAVGVDQTKAQVMRRLNNRLKDVSPSIHLNTSVTLEMCEQLTAEKRVTKFRRGFEHREWIKTRPRNELLDIWSYMLAVLCIVNPSWQALEERRKKTTEPTAKEKPRTARKNWVTGWR